MTLQTLVSSPDLGSVWSMCRLWPWTLCLGLRPDLHLDGVHVFVQSVMILKCEHFDVLTRWKVATQHIRLQVNLGVSFKKQSWSRFFIRHTAAEADDMQVRSYCKRYYSAKFSFLAIDPFTNCKKLNWPDLCSVSLLSFSWKTSTEEEACPVTKGWGWSLLDEGHPDDSPGLAITKQTDLGFSEKKRKKEREYVHEN